MVERMNETWKDIPDYPDYQASNLGRIASRRRHAWKVLSPNIGTNGYLTVQTHYNGRVRRRLIHRLVLMAFVGECPKDHEARHLNGDRKDNRLENLAWGTRAENHDDRRRHGRSGQGSKNTSAKLTETDILEIRSAFSQGVTQRELAKRFGVFEGNIEKICRRVTWKHVA
jgi:hypothetical protein